jgi:peptide/nickel transport system substrate-binding protein
VFHLRNGVKFHEGSDFNAGVVRWNSQRAVGPEENAFIAPFFSVVETSVPPEEEINPCTLAVC